MPTNNSCDAGSGREPWVPAQPSIPDLQQRIADLEAKLAAETERCAKLAKDKALEWEGHNEFGRYDSEVAACFDIERKIRGGN